MNEFSVKDIAALLGVSKPTVQSYINNNDIQASRVAKNNTRLYSYDTAVEIIRALDAEFDISILCTQVPNSAKSEDEVPNLANDSEKQGNLAQNLAQNSANSAKEQTEESDAIHIMLSMLQRELAAKDKMITELREEKIDLQGKLAQAYADITDLAKKAQYITAADKTTQLLDLQEKQKKEETIVNAPEPDEESSGSRPKDAETPAATPAETSTAGAENPEQPQKKKGFFARLFGM